MSRALASILAFVAGCGGRVDVLPDASVDDVGFNIDAGDDEGPDMRPPPSCPKTPPAVGTACVSYDEFESFCSYGDEPGSFCRTVRRCRDGDVWREARHCALGCPEAPPAVGSSCRLDGIMAGCAWADGTHCVCDHFGDDTRAWRCEPPPSDPRCPRTAPNAGTACTTEGLACDYSIWPRCFDCGPVGHSATCKRGAWHWRQTYNGP